MEFGATTVELSNTEKVFFPDGDITKGDLIRYYRRVAGVMLPHMKGRAVTMHRFPDGIEGEGFYQKEISDYFPGWIKSARVKKKQGGWVKHVVCDDAPTLVYLANQACITPHLWLSRSDKPDHPDRMVFDLDPSRDDFHAVRSAALWMKELLEELGLTPWIMTTGSRGLHVAVPLDRSADFGSVRSFAKSVAKALAKRNPKELTVEARKENRRGRVYLDYGRNAYAQTAVAPYAVRAKPGAPIATPLHWSELSRSGLDSRSFRIGNIFRRLSQKEDPWKEIDSHAQSLRGPRRRLEALR